MAKKAHDVHSVKGALSKFLTLVFLHALSPSLTQASVALQCSDVLVETSTDQTYQEVVFPENPLKSQLELLQTQGKIVRLVDSEYAETYEGWIEEVVLKSQNEALVYINDGSGNSVAVHVDNHTLMESQDRGLPPTQLPTSQLPLLNYALLSGRPLSLQLGHHRSVKKGLVEGLFINQLSGKLVIRWQDLNSNAKSIITVSEPDELSASLLSDRSWSQLFSRQNDPLPPLVNENWNTYLSVEQVFARSPLVRLFTADDETKQEVLDKKIVVGQSYTVLIYKGQLVLGENIPGRDSPKVGSSKSHIVLRDDFLQLRYSVYKMEDVAGSLRINANGTIDISGYHAQHQSAIAAQRISQLVDRILPTQIRWTANRLSTLPGLP